MAGMVVAGMVMEEKQRQNRVILFIILFIIKNKIEMAFQKQFRSTMAMISATIKKLTQESIHESELEDIYFKYINEGVKGYSTI